MSLLKPGGQWRRLPRDFGKGNTLSASFNRWRRTGVWARLLAALRQLERQRQGRPPEPSAGRGESQRSKTAGQGEAGGCDGGQQGKGRNRHLVAETLGLRIAVVVTAANTDDRLGLGRLLTRYFASGVQRLRKLWVESGSRAQWVTSWVRALKRTHEVDLEGTDKEGAGFQVIPGRWAVERTFAWLLNDRRHGRDDDPLPANSEALIQLSMIRLRLNRLA